MKKNILVVMMNLYNGGAERSLINLFTELDYSKYNVDLLLFQKKGLFLKQIPAQVNVIEQPKDLYLLYNKPKFKDFFGIRNLKLIFTRYFCTFLTNLKYRKYSQRVRKQIRWEKYYKKDLQKYEKQYDIALAYLENEPTRYVIDYTNATKKYVWFHNDYIKLGLMKEYDEYYYNKADKIVTISGECLKVLKNVFPNIKNKCIYIPNISSKKVIMNLANQKPKYEYKNDVFKIISIGRLSYEKGFDIAVETAKILKEKKVKYQWYIIGDGIMKQQLINKIKEYNLEEYLFLIGVTDNPYSYINAADILVQTSRSEGKSMVIDESKILNKPFVVTKYPTVYDQANEKIAVIVDIDAESIARGIEDLYTNEDKLKELKKNLEKQDYSNEKEINKYYQLFDE